MKKEFCHYYPKPVEEMTIAYERAIKVVFGADVEKTAGMIEFDLGYSFKYNINSGGCSVRFTECDGGTMVGLCYVIAGAMGARCGVCDIDLTAEVEQVVGVQSRNVYEEFDELVRRMSAPPPPPCENGSRQRNMPPEGGRANFCSRCGKPFAPNDNFCTNCGAPRK